MRISLCAAGCVVALTLGTSGFTNRMGAARADVRADVRPRVLLQNPEPTASDAEAAAPKPEVAALIKRSTALYAAMKSYRQNSEYFKKGAAPDGEPSKPVVFTLAMERPNKFCYKSDSTRLSAAICDGKTFINHRIDHTPDEREHTYYTKVTAPATFKDINIVDDVTFTYGTYFVALMLQGDVMADKEVRAGLAKAKLRTGVEENGKKFDVLSVPFQEHEAPFRENSIEFYFDASTHLLHKTIESVMDEDNPKQLSYKVVEIIENVLIDKPLPPNTFEYKLPKNARQVVGLPKHGLDAVAVAH